MLRLLWKCLFLCSGILCLVAIGCQQQDTESVKRYSAEPTQVKKDTAGTADPSLPSAKDATHGEKSHQEKLVLCQFSFYGL